MLVLGGSDGLYQHRGDVGELHHAPLLAAGAREVGDELRFQLVLAARGVVLQGDDLRNPPAGEFDDAGFLVEIGIGARENGDLVDAELVVANGVAAQFGITAATQFRGDVVGAQRIAHAHGFGGGEDLGVIGKRAGAQLFVDHLGIAGIEENEHSQEQDGENGTSHNQETSHRSEEEPREGRIAGDPKPHTAVFGILLHEILFSHAAGWQELTCCRRRGKNAGPRCTKAHAP